LGGEVEGAGVIQDEEMKLKEIEVTHTPGENRWIGGSHQGRGKRRGCKFYLVL